MLVRNPDFDIAHIHQPGPDSEEHLRLYDIIEFLKRHLLMTIVLTALSLLAATYYVLTTTPQYTAYARLYIDPDQVRIASSERNVGRREMGAAEVESQVEIVKSEAIAVAVIRAFDLTRENLYGERGLFDQIKSWAKKILARSEKAAKPTEEEALERAMARFYSRLGVRRVGQSYVIRISYRSANPDMAAKIANATAQAYIQANMDAETRAARSGSRWLETRTGELGEKARIAAQKVENYRAQNQLVQASSTTSLDQQQLSKISGQFLDARAQTAEFAARLKTLDDMLEENEMAEVFVGDALSSGTISRLRQELLSARQFERETIERYGVESAVSQAAAETVRSQEREVRSELQRLRQAYAADLQAAKLREQTVEASMKKRLNAVGLRSQALVKLSELTSHAETYRRMYENVLQQFETTVQKASFPVSAARVVSPATVPVVESHPKTMLIVAMAGILGLTGSLGLGIMRESLNRSLRKPSQIRGEINLPFLGAVRQTRFRRRRVDRVTRTAGRRPARRTRHLRFVLDSPISAFSEDLRGLMASIDATLPGAASKVFGITSVNPGEGKTTLSTNLALLFAARGSRTMVLSADRFGSRDPIQAFVVPRELDPATPNESETAGEDGKSAGGTYRSGSGFVVIDSALKETARQAIAPTHRAARNDAILNESLRHLAPPVSRERLAELRGDYDVVLIDLPSLKNSSNARTIAPLIDGIVLIGEHGRTGVEKTLETTRLFAESGGNLVGMVLNKTPKNWKGI